MAEVPEFRTEQDPMEVDSTFTKEREKPEGEEEQEDGEDGEQGDAQDGEQGDEEDEEGQDDENNEGFSRDGTFQCIPHKSMVTYLLGLLIDQQFGPPVLLDCSVRRRTRDILASPSTFSVLGPLSWKRSTELTWVSRGTMRIVNSRFAFWRLWEGRRSLNMPRLSSINIPTGLGIEQPNQRVPKIMGLPKAQSMNRNLYYTYL